ncbi:Gfo/Idh/MocA family protein [Streptomyces sp. NPDC014744]|uniref:Gfo/Idh/MocA family protein n=1 Tax=Streptomyces sp. NPDC014744 TaxID=3364903 RepID=UPI0036FB656C
MSETLCIAIVGTENSHAEEILHCLNVKRISPQVRVVALVGPDDERNRELAALGGDLPVVATSAELIDSVDALIVTNRDGAAHRAEAVPYLEAGKPVWVDKPLAASVQDARAIIEAADRGGVPMTSYSAVRWVPDADRVEEAATNIGDVQTVTVTGPADPDSEHSGIFFYGIHAADLAQRLAPGTPGPVEAERVAGTVVARYRSPAGVLVTLQMVTPTEAGRVPFHVEIVGRYGLVSRDIELNADYVEPGLKVFLQMLKTGRPPLTTETLLAPITVLEQLRAAL